MKLRKLYENCFPPLFGWKVLVWVTGETVCSPRTSRQMRSVTVLAITGLLSHSTGGAYSRRDQVARRGILYNHFVQPCSVIVTTTPQYSTEIPCFCGPHFVCLGA